MKPHRIHGASCIGGFLADALAGPLYNAHDAEGVGEGPASNSRPWAGPVRHLLFRAVGVDDTGGMAEAELKVWAEWLVGLPPRYHGNPNVVAAKTDAAGAAIFNDLPAEKAQRLSLT